MKKIKVIWVFLLFLLLPIAAQASWHRGWDDTWLFGLSIGYGDREGSLHSVITYEGIAVLPANIVRNISDIGVIGGGFIGYQRICRRWLFATEANVDWHDIDHQHVFAFSDPFGIMGWNASARYHRPLMAGLSGRMGYVVAPYFIPYFRLGFEVGRDKLETDFKAVNMPIHFAVQDKEWVYRFLLGTGIEFPIPCTCVTARLEFEVHSKGRTVEANGIFFDGSANPLFESKLQPETHTVRLAWVWHFPA